jgi:ChaB
MPRSSRYGPIGKLPGTLRRSCQEAQETFTEAHDSVVQACGDEDQAYRAAFVALKRKFEKRGDHWVARRDLAN